MKLFNNEIQIMSTVDHPRILKLHEYFYDEKKTLITLITEYCDGDNLENYLIKNKF